MSMKETFGDTWDTFSQNITALTGVIDTLKENFDKIQGAIKNVLNPDGDARRKREADEDATAEPEPEPEDDYYCIKQSAAGHTVKSCLPEERDKSYTFLINCHLMKIIF